MRRFAVVLPSLVFMFPYGQYQRGNFVGVELHCVYEDTIRFPRSNASEERVGETVNQLLKVMVCFFDHFVVMRC